MPDRYDEMAERVLPCEGDHGGTCEGAWHLAACPAIHRERVAAALRECAREAARRAGRPCRGNERLEDALRRLIGAVEAHERGALLDAPRMRAARDAALDALTDEELLHERA